VIEHRLGRVRAVWTDRCDGISEAPYESANLSASSGDTAEAVAENRRRLAERLGLVEPEAWWWLRQVHGAAVVVAAGSPSTSPPAADAVVTAEVGRPLAVLTADCAPIVLASDTAAGAVHAGWLGLLGGVVETAVDRLRATGTGPVRAALGPCIHPAHYEFGRSDLDRVVAKLGPSVEGRTADGHPALDVPAGVRAALDRAGVEHFDDVDVCTAASGDHFSHRRDGTTGRQALVVVLDG
jgi:YfiH family protein